MNLLRDALRKPVTIIVAVMAIVFFSVMAIRNMKVDIFPKLGLPTVYVAQPYGGLSPEQVEGFIASYYEYHFLYITGVKYVDSKSIQGAAILKIQFQEGTDMAQAMAEVVGYVNRARAFMPPGTVPPFITRFDAGSVPVGQLVFTSETKTLGEIQDLAFCICGTQPSSYPINNIYLWSSGPQEALIKLNLKAGANIPVESFSEALRTAVQQQIPGAKLSFEAGDLVNQALNLGANNPIEVAVIGRNFSQTRVIAEKLKIALQSISYLRDAQVTTPLDYPALQINIDRIKAGKLGLTVDQVSKSSVAATTSTRFTQPNYWLDKSSGTAYQVQVEYPQYTMNSPGQIDAIPLSQNSTQQLYLRDVATWQKTTTPGEYDRLNQQRYITITANIHKKDLGAAVKDVQKAVNNLGTLPTGAKINVRGQTDLLNQTMSELQSGLIIAIVVVFMMLAGYFQSFKLSFVVLSIIPAVMAGSVLLLLLTGSTLNVQSYMGMIMAVGVAVANAILFITNAEQGRRSHENNAFSTAVGNRLRPILMTSVAMIAGMIPMSLGLGEGGDQTAPLGRAVIGGLLFSLISTVLFLPLIYQAWVGKAKYKNASLDPDDAQSKFYVEK